MTYKVQGLEVASSCFAFGSDKEGAVCPSLLITIGEGMKLKKESIDCIHGKRLSLPPALRRAAAWFRSSEEGSPETLPEKPGVPQDPGAS